MGTISSGIGLISGIDYDQLIEQLLTYEARPRDRLLSRIGNIDAQKTAYMDLSARISAVVAKLTSLSRPDFFRTSTASTSNSDVLNAVAESGAAPGSYSFVVQALATTHQVVSRGFVGRDMQLPPGEVFIESYRARVNRDLSLDELNGYQGVQRGTFELIDGSGAVAAISLTDAQTLGDVVSRINAAGIDVRAELRDDRLVLVETTGAELRIREVGSGHVAADLGFGPGRTYAANGRLEGDTLVALGSYTPLEALNQGLGLRHARSGGDFAINGMSVDLSGLIKPETTLARLNHGQGVDAGVIRITTEDEHGQKHQTQIDLRNLRTVNDVKQAIEGSVEGLTVTLSENRLVIAYSGEDTGERSLKIEDVSGHAARDLGIAGESEFGKIDGRGIVHVETLADVLAAINHASDNDGSITARIDGTRLVIEGPGTIELTALNDSAALRDLGFEEGTYDATVAGRRIIGGLNGALLHTLNGGSGFEPGRIRITTATGSVTLDLSDVETLGQVVDRINQVSRDEGLGIEAAFDQTGTRLIVRSSDGTSPISISDVAGYGTFAADLGLATDTPAAELRSVNLQLQYIAENTDIARLNNGHGLNLGTIQITNTLGQSRTIDLAAADIETLGDIIAAINADADFGVVARINDTGDGLLIEDTNGGDGVLAISDQSGSAASDLNIAGSSETGSLDGSYEISITLSGRETLDDLVSQINQRGGIVSASVLNDGTDTAPYRLQLTSSASGAAGELLVSGLDFSTLSKAQDARVLLGSDPSSGVVITSSTNTISDVVPGLTIDLAGVSDQPVTVTVARDDQAIIDAVQGMIDSFNDALGRIDEYDSYDPETETRGVLLGDGTVQMIERRLTRLVVRNTYTAGGAIMRLSDLGIRYSGGELTFDQDKFEQALDENRDSVIEFFTAEEEGFAAVLKEQLEAITDPDGLIPRRNKVLDRQKDILNSRVEQLNELLESKRLRLQRQFAAMESALAAMQSQQNALAQLQSLAGSYTLGG